MREKFIPRPRDRPESTISGLDVANLEPMTGAKSGSYNRMDQPKAPWHGRGGTGINPDRALNNNQRYGKTQGGQDRERSLSRSQERLKKDDKTDLGGLRKLIESKVEEQEEGEEPMDSREMRNQRSKYSTGHRGERDWK